MVVIIGIIVAETCFRRKVGIVSMSHSLLGEASKVAISFIDAGRNYDKNFGVRGVSVYDISLLLCV